MESQLLFAESKNELNKPADTYGSKQIGFIKEKESAKPSALALRGAKVYPKV